MVTAFFAALSLLLLNTAQANPEYIRHLGEWTPHTHRFSGRETKSDTEHVLQKLPAMFQETMVTCPEKIWPDYSWKNASVFLLEKGKPAQVWQGTDNTVVTVADTEFPSESYDGAYNFFQWKGLFALSLNVSDFPPGTATAERMFGLGVHEGFHALGQKGWSSKQGSRGTVYPLDPKPRLFRRHMFDRLKAYFLSKGADKQSLAQAAYWFERWSQEFPEEVLSTTDGYEGTARYVEILATEYARLSCSTADGDMLQALLATLPSKIGGTMQPKVLQLDAEGYDMGSLAAFILQWIESAPGWHAEMSTGATPLEGLMKGKASAPDTVDNVLEQDYVNAAIGKNTAIAAMLGTSLDDYRDTSFVRVGLAGNFSAFSPKGFFLPVVLPNVVVVPMAQDITLVSTANAITVKRDTVLFSGSSPCLKQSFFTALVPKSALTVTGDVLQISSNGLDGAMKGSLQTDSDGFEWFCGE